MSGLVIDRAEPGEFIKLDQGLRLGIVGKFEADRAQIGGFRDQTTIGLHGERHNHALGTAIHEHFELKLDLLSRVQLLFRQNETARNRTQQEN